MKICDICKCEINTNADVRTDSVIDLGYKDWKYEVCEKCVRKVANFIERSKK